MGKKKQEEARVQLAVRFTADVAERLRNMTHATGKPYQRLIEEATIAALERVEKEKNGGKPFPPRPKDGP